MRTKYHLGTLAVAVLAMAGCEDITNPVEEFGQLSAPWVGFEAPRTVSASHGAWVPVRFGGISVRPEVDVNVTFAFDGTADFGEDFLVVAGEGSTQTATGFSATGGSAVVEYDPLQQAAVDTLWLYIPTTATVGSVVEIAMTDAATPAGDSIGAGFEGSFNVFEVMITAAPAEIPTGTYSGALSGGLGGATTVTISEADGSFDYQISDIAAGAFGVPVAWEFSVLSDGTTQWSATPRDYSLAALGMSGGITGSYDFTTNTLTWTVAYVPGFSWSGTVTLD